MYTELQSRKVSSCAFFPFPSQHTTAHYPRKKRVSNDCQDESILGTPYYRDDPHTVVTDRPRSLIN